MVPVPRSSLTILVVDDEPAVLHLVKSILEPAGYAVLVASSAQQALGLVEKGNAVDLLLTDINMPRISGLVLASRFSELTPHLPVMFMTGHRADNFGIEVLLREGSFSECKVIYKPFTARELISEVAGVFERPRVRSQGGW